MAGGGGRSRIPRRPARGRAVRAVPASGREDSHATRRRGEQGERGRDSAKEVAEASFYHRELVIACTQAQGPTDIDRIAREAEASVMTEPDPEEWYRVGALMAYCGQKDAAMRLLKAAVQQNYCAYSALPADPLFQALPKDTALNQVLPP